MCIDWWFVWVLIGYCVSGGGLMLEFFRLRVSGKVVYIGL